MEEITEKGAEHMAMIKCKMCGGDLQLLPGATVCECEYCGSRQTVPAADDGKKLSLFARANRLRLNCEFDKAEGLYESIVADYPEEAEGYWGLVLCKYGIEYVTDPASGKKIPTCHRSSFDSVLKDSNFQLAQEYADVVARKICREEAKRIEEIRKGILTVSASEEPYDIFICYKETGFDGKRTLDSVLAQDLYDALTGKGYRVFFSRISLEDKLGTAYEPYIFAALNSAKIMLVVGTEYEYFNAVWVKNEWSRFLKLMAKDSGKYLIPCYKGIDAYDMPEEFARLQAQDLDKMGATQDILRGVEKLLPKAAPTVVVQERVVMGSAAGNKITSLLDRGYMALEDGDWAKADSFFEDVLNNDSKNAQAYLGKTLAAEHCRTLDALIRKRQDLTKDAKAEHLELESDNAYVDAQVQRYTVPGYVFEREIRELYRSPKTYLSRVAQRKQQYAAEETWWATHKSLARAEKFASGEFADTLAKEKKRLFAALAHRVKQAEEEAQGGIRMLHKCWEEQKRLGDEKAAALHEEGCRNRERDYEKNLLTAKNTQDPGALDKCAKAFADFGDFRDSRALAKHCRTRAEEIREENRQRHIAEKARRAEEEERRLIARRKAEREAAARKKKQIALICAAAALVLAVFLVITKVVIPSSEYKKAKQLEANGKNLEAAMVYGALGDYRDSGEKAMALWAPIAQRHTIAAGGNHTIGIKADGTVAAAGDNGKKQCNVSGWTGLIDVAAGYDHSVGLRPDGTVVATGWNGYGQCDVEDWKNIVSLAAGSRHTLGLCADGTVAATAYEGSAYEGQCDVDGWKNIVAIAAGVDFSLGLRSDGTVVSAGNDDMGKCDVDDWTDIVAVSAGNFHTVGLKSDGTVVAVGKNDEGQCNVSGWTNIVAIAAGGRHTLGLRADGTVVAAGLDTSDQCGVHEWKDIVAIAAGSYHSVALHELAVMEWTGMNYNGQCDLMQWIKMLLPEQAEGLQKITENLKLSIEAENVSAYDTAAAQAARGDYFEAAKGFFRVKDYRDSWQRCLELWGQMITRQEIALGYYHTVKLEADGTVRSAGRNNTGQRDLSDWRDIVTIAAGAYHTLGLRADGTVIAAGKNEYGQLKVESWTDIVNISAGIGHTVGLKSDGTVVAVGFAGDGRCDLGGWSDIAAIAAGGDHTVGLKNNGTVLAEGLNTSGQCDVSGWTDIVAVAAGGAHTIGLKSDGTVVAVGNNAYHQCDVSDWTDIVAIAAGHEHTLGLKSDGTVVAAGRNKDGQCSVESWKDMAAIYAAGWHTVGMKENGTIVAVGYNEYGQCDGLSAE